MENRYGFTRFDNINEFKNWLKNKKVTRTVKTIQVHHTYSPSYSNFYKSNGTHEDELTRQYNIKTFHVKTNGWSDIAQHFLICPNGKIVTGRDLNKTPIGIKGWNTNSICIEIYGDFSKGKDVMTKEQKEAVIACYGELCKKFNITPSTNTIRPHCWFSAGGTYLGDYNPSRSAKSCPGTNFMGIGNTKSAFTNHFIPWIKDYIANGSTTTPSTPAPTPTPQPTQPSTGLTGKYIVRYLQTVLNQCYGNTLVVDGYYGAKTEAVVKAHPLKVGSKNNHVIWLQKALINRGYKIEADGIFGTATKSALMRYQSSRGLTADGIAGVKTHEKIIND